LCFQTPLQFTSHHKPFGYVGFASLPDQVHRKSSVEVGESGLVKSTLINSLFLTDLYSKDCPETVLPLGVALCTLSVRAIFNGTKCDILYIK
uniref:Uncharacterized protein n=1 Tax=Neolamprologus brichardi TaxID=32507 RepID=A0A3Q4G7Q0_NEOBR